jgi:hypothetical protein
LHVSTRKIDICLTYHVCLITGKLLAARGDPLGICSARFRPRPNQRESPERGTVVRPPRESCGPRYLKFRHGSSRTQLHSRAPLLLGRLGIWGDAIQSLSLLSLRFVSEKTQKTLIVNNFFQTKTTTLCCSSGASIQQGRSPSLLQKVTVHRTIPSLFGISVFIGFKIL